MRSETEATIVEISKNIGDQLTEIETDAREERISLITAGRIKFLLTHIQTELVRLSKDTKNQASVQHKARAIDTAIKSLMHHIREQGNVVEITFEKMLSFQPDNVKPTLREALGILRKSRSGTAATLNHIEKAIANSIALHDLQPIVAEAITSEIARLTKDRENPKLSEAFRIATTGKIDPLQTALTNFQGLCEHPHDLTTLDQILQDFREVLDQRRVSHCTTIGHARAFNNVKKALEKGIKTFLAGLLAEAPFSPGSIPDGNPLPSDSSIEEIEPRKGTPPSEKKRADSFETAASHAEADEDTAGKLFGGGEGGSDDVRRPAINLDAAIEREAASAAALGSGHSAFRARRTPSDSTHPVVGGEKDDTSLDDAPSF